MARKLKVDFTDVEAFVKCEEGQHVAVLREINEEESQNGSDMLVAKFEVVKGNSTGAIVYNNFVLGEKSLWRLKGYLEAVGIKADGKLQIDLDKLIGKKCIIEVSHEEYKGQLKARIDEFKPLGKAVKEEEPEDDDEDEEEEDEKPAKKPAKKPSKPEKKPDKKGKKKPEPEDDDEDDDWEED